MRNRINVWKFNSFFFASCFAFCVCKWVSLSPYIEKGRQLRFFLGRGPMEMAGSVWYCQEKRKWEGLRKKGCPQSERTFRDESRGENCESPKNPLATFFLSLSTLFLPHLCALFIPERWRKCITFPLHHELFPRDRDGWGSCYGSLI